MINLEAVDNRLLVEKISDTIIYSIISNKLKEGDKLPNEFILAKNLSVSRSTIREAVKISVSKNILEIKRGFGTFVCQSPGLTNDPLGFIFIQDKAKLALDLLEVRKMIEPKMAAMAACYATASQIKSMEKYCEKIKYLFEKGEPHFEEDIKFHLSIANASNNIVLTNLIPIINKQGIELVSTVTQNILKDETIKTHRLILNAIIDKDEQLAHDAMQKHLNHNVVYINECIYLIKQKQ